MKIECVKYLKLSILY